MSKEAKFSPLCTVKKKNCDVVEQNGVYVFVTEVKCYRLTLVWFTSEKVYGTLLTKNIKFQTTVKKNCDVVEQNGVRGFVTEVKC